jgi:hypothetical protein
VNDTDAKPGLTTIPVRLLRPRPVDCPHDYNHRAVVSDCVIYRDLEPDFGPRYEIGRQVVVCTACGWIVELRDVERNALFP